MAGLEVFVDGVDFGEGPRWHDGRLWYSDFFQQSVYAVDPSGAREVIVKVPTQPSGLGWMPDGSLLVVSMLDRKLLRVDGDTVTEHADLSSVATFHCNDMVVSATGNAYVGNFGWDIFTGGRDAVRAAALALVRPDGTVSVAAEGLQFPNGSVITPDGETLVVGESYGARYRAFTIAPDGTLHDQRVWAEVPGCAPDGCSLDAAGGIWFADARGQRVVRVVEGGEITDVVETGVGTYACALGGDDGRTLFILTAPDAHPDRVAGRGEGAILMTTVAEPHAGLP
ncbi:MAG: SMP-30/gluconolactonase/LRE family protein [Actinomycetota bacterium]|nr:SMP-30/gluconolactonase/LRE family protein [Actinomycetota bacterium]